MFNGTAHRCELYISVSWSASDFTHLVSALLAAGGAPALTSVEIDDVPDIGDAQWTALARALAQCGALRQVVMCASRPDGNTRAFAETLVRDCAALKNISIRAHDARFWTRALFEMRSLLAARAPRLSVSFSVESASEFAIICHQNFKSCVLSAASVVAPCLAQLLDEGVHFSSLSLGLCYFSSVEMATLIDALVRAPGGHAVRHLSLYSRRATAADIAGLCALVGANTALKYLFVSCVALDDTFARRLAGALASNTRLESIALFGRVTDAGLAHIARVLRGAPPAHCRAGRAPALGAAAPLLEARLSASALRLVARYAVGRNTALREFDSTITGTIDNTYRWDALRREQADIFELLRARRAAR